MSCGAEFLREVANFSIKVSLRSELRRISFSCMVRMGIEVKSMALTASNNRARTSTEGFEKYSSKATSSTGYMITVPHQESGGRRKDGDRRTCLEDLDERMSCADGHSLHSTPSACKFWVSDKVGQGMGIKHLGTVGSFLVRTKFRTYISSGSPFVAVPSAVSASE